MSALLPGAAGLLWAGGLLACSQAFEDPGGSTSIDASDWGGPVGRALELVPAGAPGSVPLLIHVEEGAWELRLGDLWRTATPLELLDAQLDPQGYSVGDSLLLPAGLAQGTSVDGTTIQDRGPVEVWYGTFPDALSVEVGQGTFRGAAAFSLGVGPIALSYGGRDWELAGYTWTD